MARSDIGCFYTSLEMHIPSGMDLSKQVQCVWFVYSCSIKTGTRQIMLLDEVSLIVHCLGVTNADSSSRLVISVMPVV